ncbi:MAG TPA: aminodeoxychorismate synthase component I [Patescibacteria group bacterium]|nr:aminodeoxychorismate synthase component I [Patescibacteria group bacterium]
MTSGVFTTIKVKQGIPIFLEEHENRLLSQAKSLQIKQPSGLEKKIKNFITKNSLVDCALRVEITSKGRLICTFRPLPVSSSIRLLTIPDTRDEKKIYKTTDRSVNEKAKKFAEEHNADDALFTENNKLTESTIANIFSVNKNGDIITSPLNGNGLRGIARKIIIENFSIIEENIPENTRQPIILTNSLRIQKVTYLNGKKLKTANTLFEKIKNVLEKAEQEYINKQLMKLSNNKKIEIFYKQMTWHDPAEIFTLLFGHEKSNFWLDSSLTNETARFSYMGIPESIITYLLKENITNVNKNGSIKKIKQNIFDYLDTQLKDNIIESDSLPFPFIGGYVGYFGYELKKLTGSIHAYQSPYPDSLWFYTTKTIVFDHKEKKVYLVCLAKKKTDAERWFKDAQNKLLFERSRELLDAGFRPYSKNKSLNFKLDRDHDQYLKEIKLCKQYLQKGESYQICLTNQFHAKGTIDPLQLYHKLRKTNPAPYSAFIKYNDLAILSSSPEEFLKIDNQFVETKPIKGTVRRGEYPEDDRELIKQLLESKKDWSENAMIVDLLRNDLGKICEFGSVKVSKLMKVETYQTVHQLVSTVIGKLKKDSSIIDVVKATFPGGSMTGAPKIRTMEIIDNLEKKARGIYSGSIGFLSLNKKALLNIVIRTLILHKNTISIGAGGAILADSDVEKEYEEMLLKASVLLQTTTTLYNPGMHNVFLALGSNVGNKKANMNNAITLLGKDIHNITVSNFYETKPMYYENQNTFLNSTLRGETTLSPQELILFVKHIEKEIGRKKRFRNGPREIDIDILFYDDLIFKTEHVQIPHPRIQERPFVLKPLMDLDPNFTHPVLKKTIKELSQKITTNNL